MLSRVTEVLAHRVMYKYDVQVHCYHRPGFNRNHVIIWGPPGIWNCAQARGLGVGAFLLRRLLFATGPFDFDSFGQERGIVSLGGWADEIALNMFFSPSRESISLVKDYLGWATEPRDEVDRSTIIGEWTSIRRAARLGFLSVEVPLPHLLATSLGYGAPPEMKMPETVTHDMEREVIEELKRFKPTTALQVGGSTAKEIAQAIDACRAGSGREELVSPLPPKLIVNDDGAILPIAPDELPLVWVIKELVNLLDEIERKVSINSLGSFSLATVEPKMGASAKSAMKDVMARVTNDRELLKLSELSLLANLDDFNMLDLYLQELIRVGDAEMKSLKNYRSESVLELLQKWVDQLS